MGKSRQGSAKMLPRLWSLEVASRLAPVIDARAGRRRQFAKDSGISEGRLSKLLNGNSAWYLEDVDTFCRVLGLDSSRLIDELMATVTVTLSADAYATAASEPGREIGSDPDSSYDGGA